MLNDKYICRVCGSEIIYKGRQLYRRQHSHLGIDICFKCAKLDANKRISNSVKKIWKDDTYKNRLVKSHKDHAKKQLKENPNYYSELSNHFWEFSNEKINERNKKLSKSLKKYWFNLSDEEKQTRVKPLLDGLSFYWENISPEEKKKRIEKMHKGLEVWKSTLTDEELSDLLNIFVIWKKNLTDKEIIEVENKQRQAVLGYYNNLSEEDRRKRNENISNSVKERWKNYSQEEKDKRINILREGFMNYWNNLTPEEYSKWNYKRSIGQGIANSKPKDTEIEFMNLLKIYDIKYQFQCYNQIEHPDFKTIFPYNPITGSNKIYPFHKWDFIIYNDFGNILIDIDGSIHTVEPGKMVINGLDIGAYEEFNDMQRPYQTDGLDAYIVLAYDDNLDINTPVYSIKDQKIIPIKDLLLILSANKKEISNNMDAK